MVLHCTRRALLDAVRRGEEGQDLAEYVLLLALIAMITIVGVASLGASLQDYYHNVIAPALANLL